MQLPDYVCFSRFELLPAERKLLDTGCPVELGARAFDLLIALGR
jgi:DNA-binding winged helix-turn-helix (wHTH) protein